MIRSVNALRPLSQVYIRSVATAPQATDPIQKAFIQKLKEYETKSKYVKLKYSHYHRSSPSGLADATPQEMKNLDDMLTKIDTIFAAAGKDMTQFPTFNFSEPQLVHPHSSINADLPEEKHAVDEAEEKRTDEKYVLVI